MVQIGTVSRIGVISDEEFGAEQEKEEEDREVARIFNESHNTQQKLLKGTDIIFYSMSKQSTHCVQNKLHSMVRMSKQSIHVFNVYYYCVFLTIRQVAAGHRAVAEGWTLFEQTCEEVGPGELPQLLRQLKSATTPTPTPGPTTPTKKEESSEVPMEAGDIEVKQEEHAEINKTPIMIKLGGHQYQFKCGNCDITPKATRCAMNAHIHSVHTKEALVCYMCPFMT